MYRMEFHHQQLEKHCRICGKRLCKVKKQAPSYCCNQFPADLLSTFGLDISKDLSTVHPTHFCNLCYSVTKRAERARKAGLPYTHTTVIMEWTTHDEDDCLVSTAQKKKCIIHTFFRSVNTLSAAPMVAAKTGRF